MRKTYVLRDGKLVEKDTAPPLRKGPHVMPDIQPYRAVGPEYGRVIKSRSEHRAYLKQHGLIEVGNERKYFGI